MKKTLVLFAFVLTLSVFQNGEVRGQELVAEKSDIAKEAALKIAEHPLDLVSSSGEVIPYAETIADAEDLDDDLLELFEKISGPFNPVYSPVEVDVENMVDVGTGDVIDIGNEISPSVVVGPDQRRKVSNSLIQPYRSLTFISVGSNGLCSGAVTGTNHVLTAAHCVDSIGAANLQVYPALNDSNAPLSEYRGIEYFVPAGWFTNSGTSQHRYDYAVIRVGTFNGRTISSQAGTTPHRVVSNLNLSATYKLYGYPSDKLIDTGLISLWGMTGSLRNQESHTVTYTIDTYGGQSGAAILNNSNQVVGVHTLGFRNANGQGIYNSGVKLTQSVVNHIRSSVAR
ncbi:hypothetical protein DH09_16960 [Bacillaceae bacterium JMAK1]|nr:hypothetical protein DH09_16960 [Bacillaceae bacterium JMAK1]